MTLSLERAIALAAAALTVSLYNYGLCVKDGLTEGSEGFFAWVKGGGGYE